LIRAFYILVAESEKGHTDCIHNSGKYVTLSRAATTNAKLLGHMQKLLGHMPGCAGA